MICKVCNTENADTARFCGNCGSILPSTCPHCGADTTNAETFCPACGEVVHVMQTEVVKIQTDAPDKPLEMYEDKHPQGDGQLKPGMLIILFIAMSAPVLILAAVMMILDAAL